MKKIKFNKKIKQFLFTFGILLIIFSLAFVPSVSAIGDNNNGVLVYNIDTKYSSSLTSIPSSTAGYKTYQYANTNQVGFIADGGANNFSKNYYRYCTFNLKNTNAQTYIITIRFVAYYGQSGLSIPFGFDSPSDAWVNTVRYGLGDTFDYSQTDTSGNYTFNGGQFSFGLNPNSSVNVVLCGGLQESLANSLYFDIDIEATPYNSNQDIINNQNQNTQDIIDNQNENADKINGTIDDIFNGEHYDNFDNVQSGVGDYANSEDEIKDKANDYLDSVKGDLWDSNLLNPEVNSPIKGFRAISMIFDTFLEDCPSLYFIVRLSISFGILAFVLGLATLLRRGSRNG